MASMNSDIRVRGRNSGLLAGLIIGAATLALLVSVSVSLLPFTASAAGVNLFSNGFESSNFSAWSFADNDWHIISDKHSGNKGAEVSGADGDELLKTVSTEGRANITLSFWYKVPGGLDSGDHVAVQWSTDGFNWNTLHDYAGTATMSNWAQASFTLPAGAENASGFRFRFFGSSLGSGDKFRLDDVSLDSGAIFNTAPVAANGSATTNEDTAKVITLSATDADGNSLTYSIVSNPLHGTLGTVVGNQVTYTPAANYNGSDSFTFKANDGTANSNIATVSITVSPINDLPVITLNGASTVTVAFAGSYTELGAVANDVEDGSNLTVTTIDSSSVNVNAIGSYTVTYNFTDSNGGAAAQVTRTVNVVDQGNPTVVINPASQVVEATGPTGAAASFTTTVTDDVDTGLTATCDHASGDVFALGITTITCQATDSSNNTGSNSATVEVKDTTKPVITLNGSSTVTIVVGGSYTELGASAFDIVDGTTTATVGGDIVDASTTGTYVVTYNTTDAHGNAADQVSRTVTVVPQPVENTSTLCSDGIDNDGDTLVDLNDPDCAAFIPAPVVTPTSGGNGGGGGGGGGVVSGPLSIGFVNTNNGGIVLGTSTEALPEGCSVYLNSYLKQGNSGSEVKKLQSFLNSYMNAGLPVSGVFGPMTLGAVKAFQLKHADEVLAPWLPFGLASDHTATGYVYKTTKYKINLIQCSTLNVPKPQLP